MLAPVGLRFVWLRGPRLAVAQYAGFGPRSWADAVSRWPGGGIRSAAPLGRASESRSPDAGDSKTLPHKMQVRSGKASSLRMSGFFNPPRLPCAIPMLAPVGLRFVWLRGPRLAVAQCAGFGPRSWADAVSRWPGGGIRSAAPLGRASESRSPDAGDSRTPRHKTDPDFPPPALPRSGFSLAGSGQATRRSRASRYLAAVFSSTSWGRRGAGGVLSHVWVSSQSRTNCLSNEGGLMPTR